MSVTRDKTLRIWATVLEDDNGDNDYGGDGGDAIYVQCAKPNGQDWKKNWFEHRDVMVQGGTIEFVLGREMKMWEEEEGGVLPPSPGRARVLISLLAWDEMERGMVMWVGGSWTPPPKGGEGGFRVLFQTLLHWPELDSVI